MLVKRKSMAIEAAIQRMRLGRPAMCRPPAGTLTAVSPPHDS